MGALTTEIYATEGYKLKVMCSRTKNKAFVNIIMSFANTLTKIFIRTHLLQFKLPKYLPDTLSIKTISTIYSHLQSLVVNNKIDRRYFIHLRLTFRI